MSFTYSLERISSQGLIFEAQMQIIQCAHSLFLPTQHYECSLSFLPTQHYVGGESVNCVEICIWASEIRPYQISTSYTLYAVTMALYWVMVWW